MAFVVEIERKIERNRVGLLLGEVCAVLLTVEDDEEHVSRSECVVPISTVGNDQSQALHLAWELSLTWPVVDAQTYAPSQLTLWSKHVLPSGP